MFALPFMDFGYKSRLKLSSGGEVCYHAVCKWKK
ncbi:Uncharacterised protein [Neisseria animalis]|nr:Uncharacterised protein [Neisseria animalis]